jgi:hypothetical protein
MVIDLVGYSAAHPETTKQKRIPMIPIKLSTLLMDATSLVVSFPYSLRNLTPSLGAMCH